MLPHQERCLERSPDALYRTIDGQAVILHAGTGVYFSLNTLGSRIWELLEHRATAASLCTRLIEEFEVTEDVLAKDVPSFLEELEKAGLVRDAA